jgi:hypothetical protein
MGNVIVILCREDKSITLNIAVFWDVTACSLLAAVGTKIWKEVFPSYLISPTIPL